MIFALDYNDTTPIYVQLRNCIVLAIGRGELQPGERIPTIRQLAEDVGVNPMTVSKAYTIMKNEGFIQVDRRHGAQISMEFPDHRGFHQRLESELRLYATEASLRGMDETSFMAMCQEIYRNIQYRPATGEIK